MIFGLLEKMSFSGPDPLIRQRLGGSLLVGRADNDAALPREEEEEPTVARIVIEESHVLGGVISRQDDVGA